ncbi:hypothetical protein DVH05_002656 [Phytophthora capsici]|nr:hypothetical protein DVH05_002656 [Phytophthora capsici]
MLQGMRLRWSLNDGHFGFRGKCGPGNGSGLHDAAGGERCSSISRDSCQAAVPETQLEGEVESVQRPAEDVEKLPKREKKNAIAEAMFTLGEVDSEGVEAKYITMYKEEAT